MAACAAACGKERRGRGSTERVGGSGSVGDSVAPLVEQLNSKCLQSIHSESWRKEMNQGSTAARVTLEGQNQWGP